MPYRIGPYSFDTIRLDPEHEILRLRVHDTVGASVCFAEPAPGQHWFHDQSTSLISELELHSALDDLRQTGSMTITLPDETTVDAPDIAGYLHMLGVDRPYIEVLLPDQFIVQFWEESEWFPLSYMEASELVRQEDGSYEGPSVDKRRTLKLRCVAINAPAWGDGPDWLTVVNGMGEHRRWRLLPRPPIDKGPPNVWRLRQV